MPSGGFLPNTSVAPSYLGTYVGNFPNPIKSLTIFNIVYNNYSFSHYPDPAEYAPGDIGKVAFY